MVRSRRTLAQFTSSVWGEGSEGHDITPRVLIWHGPLQMAGLMCNYLALENIYGMLILRIRAFSSPEL